MKIKKSAFEQKELNAFLALMIVRYPNQVEISDNIKNEIEALPVSVRGFDGISLSIE
ncbi:MAG: hypothetical protein JST86_09940 [Bacteroidetes bacterium]|nr:hypothetical protein [Bacteroidota bacterium]